MSENRISRSLALACGAFPMVLLSGCGATPPPITGRLTPQPVAELGQSALIQKSGDDYLLHTSDTIAITVFREPDLSSASLQIGPDGLIAMPLLGQIRAEGKTVAQLADEIKRGLSPNYILNPSVSVNVVQYGSHTVSVEGAVNGAGLFAFKPGTRLSGAIALAGGLSRVAKSSQVAVFRPDGDGMLVARFDYGALSSGKMIDPELMPNDRVVVGTSGLAQAYQDFLTTIPILGLFVRFTR